MRNWVVLAAVGLGLLEVDAVNAAVPVANEPASALTLAGGEVFLDQDPERLFFRRSGGDGTDEATRRYWSFAGHADAVGGRMVGAAQTISGELAPQSGDMTLELKSKFQVVAGDGVPTEPSPIEWEARIGSLAVNIDDGTDGGEADVGHVEMRISLALSIPAGSRDTLLQQAYFESRWAAGPSGFVRASPTVASPGTIRLEELLPDPETGAQTTLRSTIRTADGGTWVEMVVPNWTTAREGTRGMVMRLGTKVTPGSPQTYHMALKVVARVFSRGGRAAAEWRDVKLGYRVPEGIRLEGQNGQDMSGLDAIRPAGPEAATLADVQSWEWEPAGAVLTMRTTSGGIGSVELQETTDLLSWETIGRAEPGTTEPTFVIEPFEGLGARRPPARLYRAVTIER